MSEGMSNRLDGRCALVTGGSRGIGRAICVLLAARGATVAVHYGSNAQGAEETARMIREAGGKAVVLGADLADGGQADGLAARAIEALGQVDILVNNAGEMGDGSVEAMTDEAWDRPIAINLSAAFRCMRGVVPGMKARGWGRIVSVTSQAAFNGSANHASYAASKAGLLGLTYSLAKEVGPNGITVNLVSPGRVMTEMVASRSAGRVEEWLKQTPLRRFGEEEDVASAVAFLVSDEAGYITGATLHVNGGLLMS